MKLISINSVALSVHPDVYSLVVEADIEGKVDQVPFVSYPDDPYGLGPDVRSAIDQWIEDGHPVGPYVPPTAEDTRASLPSLSPRQLLLALYSIGITEADVDALLVDDPSGTIEWRKATSFDRGHPLIDAVGLSLSIPPEQIDALWVWAAAL